MALHKDEAIVLFKRPFGESDKIIRLFTLNSGKVAAIAKGAGKSQKRFMNTLEPFNHIRVEYFEKPARAMVRIENADIVETNRGMETSLRKVSLAGFFTEFVDRLTKEREPHDTLFFLLKEALGKTKMEELTYPEFLCFQLRMLETLGFLPNFHSCVCCGTSEPHAERTYFSKERGGIVCGPCARSTAHEEYCQGIIPWLASLKDGNGEAAQTSFEYEARDLMEGFIAYHLDVSFKSYRILKPLMF